MKKLAYSGIVLLLSLILLQNFTSKMQEGKLLQTAQTFLNTLEQVQIERATFSLADEERYNWNYTPVARQGLPIKDMTKIQQEAAFALMRASLSEKGYKKAQQVRELEAILRGVEGREVGDAYRDPDNFYFTIFGKPAHDEAWGWRFEGHHISLNFSSVSDKIVSVTPTFFGSNPAKVPSGPKKGWRILEPEEDLGRALVKSLSQDQQQTALIAKEAYPDIVTTNEKIAKINKKEGLLYNQMNKQQQEQLMQLIEVYYNVHQPEIVQEAILSMEKAGLENIHFAWAGSYDVGEKHYYRIHGPTFVIEYDNTQNDANHIHTVIRDLEKDFGEDILSQHYEEAHK
ncbi:DUF3500 domain-containing protein [Catalinimonas niigatensis]|uniref:DUF3500 domain-containing protein n=1 Tax=Catalinimonas niigatensis TaxID=1397264 RepID=UPI002666FA97|nr:DUF3500 domain-containing protein [Catalinimonas niigatensis]WPP52725.1 DUF3500 domain-containing protein [Catalinimonas niigatensis]